MPPCAGTTVCCARTSSFPAASFRQCEAWREAWHMNSIKEVSSFVPSVSTFSSTDGSLLLLGLVTFQHVAPAKKSARWRPRASGHSLHKLLCFAVGHKAVQVSEVRHLP